VVRPDRSGDRCGDRALTRRLAGGIVPRKERLFIAGMPQLIALKGNNNEAIFRDDADYRHFVSCLQKAAGSFDVGLHAYTLLTSQVYLLLSAGSKESLARFTQFLGRCYVAWFNKRHVRTGVLWEGRFRSCSVEPASYFLLCQKWIETRTPEGDSEPGDTPWNSLRAHTGHEALHFLTPHPVWLALAAEEPARWARYRQFLSTPLGASFISRVEDCLRQNCVLGTLNYCLELESQLHQPVRPRQSGRPRKHYPHRMNYWLWLEQEARSCIQGAAYREIRLPLLEAESGGGTEDWPANLRSEGTLCCLHAIAGDQGGASPCRLWYQGPMFRTDPQTGTQVEQFHQIGVEALGYGDIDIELEQLLIQYDLFQRFKLSPHLELQINTLGDPEDLLRYREILRRHIAPAMKSLNAVQTRIAASAPEALLALPGVLPSDLQVSAPLLFDCLGDKARIRFERLTRALQAAGVPYTHRANLFPQHPFYQHTFFEWQSTLSEVHALVCQGGRYDALASRVLQRETSAFGFAFMVEPMIRLAEQSHAGHRLENQRADIAVLNEGAASVGVALALGHALREAYPFLAVVNDFSNGRMAGKQARAVRNGARIVVCVENAGHADLLLTEVAERLSCPVDQVVHLARRALI